MISAIYSAGKFNFCTDYSPQSVVLLSKKDFLLSRRNIDSTALKTGTLSFVNHLLFLAVFCAAGAYLVYKAVWIPITHDEVATTLFYSKFSSWEIMMYPDEWPNNHILNTLLAKYCIALFGPEQWAVRLPNLLSFALYAYAAYRSLRLILKSDSWFFVPFALLFLSNPYLLDFFALSRGYGMSIALSAAGASFLLSGFAQQNQRHIWLALLLSILASYANFTLLLFWVPVTLAAAFYFLLRHMREKNGFFFPWLLIALLNIGYLALIYTPIHKMQSTDQFIYWTSNGFLYDTVLPLIWLSCQGSHLDLPFLILAFAGFALMLLAFFHYLYTAQKGGKSENFWQHPVLWSVYLLFATAFVNLLQTWIMGTPNLFGRTALFFYPLYMIALLGTASFVRTRLRHKALRISIIVLLCFFTSYHFFRSGQPGFFKEWYYDAYTFEVMDYLKTHSETEKPELETHWLFNPSFQFYHITDSIDWYTLGYYKKELDSTTTYAYYYVPREDTSALQPKFNVVAHFGGNCLMRRSEPLAE